MSVPEDIAGTTASLKTQTSLQSPVTQPLPDEEREWEIATAKAKSTLLKQAEEYRRDAARKTEIAEELERRARELAVRSPSTSLNTPRAEAAIRDWRNAKRSTALHDYMRSLPMGKHVPVAEVVSALRSGGCKNVEGKPRPGKTTPQMEAERNVLIAVTRSKELEHSEETREIWRNDRAIR